MIQKHVRNYRLKLEFTSWSWSLDIFDNVCVIYLITSSLKHRNIPVEYICKKSFVVANAVDEGNRNHTVDLLRLSNWIVEVYHQYRHDEGNAGWFPLFNVEFGVLDIVIVLEFFFPSCAPINTYTCGNNLPAIDESVKCTSAWIFWNYRFGLRWKMHLSIPSMSK